MAVRLDNIPADAFAITPSDTASIAAASLWTGSGGTISVVTEAGTTVAFANVPAGTVLRLRVTKVRATGTSATGIVGFI